MDNTLQNPSTIPPASPPQTPAESYGGSLNQMGAGPIAAAIAMLTKILSMNNSLMTFNNNLTQEEIATQATTLNLQARALQDASYHQAMSYVWDAVGAFSGFATSLGQGIVEKFNTEDLTKMNVAQGKLDDLTDIDNLPYDKQNLIIGDNNQVVDQNRLNQEAKNLAEQMVIKPDTQIQGNRGLSRQDGINHMSPEQYNTFKENLQTKIDTEAKNVNTHQTALQVRQTRINTYGQIVQNLASGSTKMGQSSSSMKSGQNQATEKVVGGVNQMAGQTAQSTQGNVNKSSESNEQAIRAAAEVGRANPQ